MNISYFEIIFNSRKRVAGLRAEAAGNTPEQFVEFIRAELAKWEKLVKVVKVSGARVD